LSFAAQTAITIAGLAAGHLPGGREPKVAQSPHRQLHPVAATNFFSNRTVRFASIRDILLLVKLRSGSWLERRVYDFGAELLAG
jgi:hypothetical protein